MVSSPVTISVSTWLRLFPLTLFALGCQSKGGTPGSGSVASGAQLASTPACKATSRLGEVCRLAVADVRPTQFAVGYRSVSLRQKKLEKHLDNPTGLDSHLEKDPGLVVIGPGGTPFLVDGHHLGRSLWNTGVKETYGNVAGNYADLGEADFWKLMDEKKWVFLFDEKGEGPLAFSALPQNLGALRDDPYRSLAGFARDAGAFEKSDVPFAEFRWAEFLRTRVPLDVVVGSFDAAVKRAVELARTPEAAGLPGSQAK